MSATCQSYSFLSWCPLCHWTHWTWHASSSLSPADRLSGSCTQWNSCHAICSGLKKSGKSKSVSEQDKVWSNNCETSAKCLLVMVTDQEATDTLTALWGCTEAQTFKNQWEKVKQHPASGNLHTVSTLKVHSHFDTRTNTHINTKLPPPRPKEVTTHNLNPAWL